MAKVAAEKYLPHFYAEQHIRIRPLTKKWFLQPKVISVTIAVTIIVATITAVFVLLSTTVDSTDCGTPPTVVDGWYTSTGTAIGSNATYTCRTGWDMIGTPNSHCSPAGWIGSRICQIGDCGEPDNLTFGYRTYTRTTYAAVVLYSCDIGYNLHGNDTTVCQDDDTWNGTRYCQIVDCLDPDNITDGFVHFNLTTYGENATYSCRTGWDMYGDSHTQCAADGNWTGVRNCTIGNCGTPPVVDHGYRNYTATTYQAIVEYFCDIGYNLTGELTAECLDDDSWSGNRTCDLVDCGVPQNVSNGYAVYENTTYQSVATYTCEAGYDLGGDIESHCQPDGQWNGTSTCTIKDCGTPPTVTDGTPTYATTTYLSTVDYTCSTGYTLNGTATINCQADGTWETEPTCVIKDCGTPPTVTDGTPTYTTTTYLSTVDYTCSTGYTLNGTATINCQADGTWEAGPTCDIKDCGTPPTVTDGTPTYTTTTYLSTAAYTCSTGYTLNGAAVINCQADGTWEAEPTCDIKDCGTPPAVTDGTPTYTTTTYLSTVDYTCSTGYTLNGTATINCPADGIWETEPTCVIKDCGNPTNVPGGTRTFTTTTYLSTATYTCDTGYNMVGGATITCQDTGAWSVAPSCDIVDCGTPPASSADGTITFGATTFSASATYSCNVGYNLVGTATVTCQADGTWSGTAPSCDIVDCGAPDVVADATFMPDPPTTTTYGATVTYTCDDPALTVTPTDTSTCQAGGAWSDSGLFSCA